MNVLHRILGHLNVLKVIFSDADTYHMELLGCMHSSGSVVESKEIVEMSEVKKELSTYPLLLAVSGYGVISKEIAKSSDIVDRVMSDNSDFIWSTDQERIIFVRKEQLRQIYSELEENKAKLLSTVCLGNNNNSSTLDICNNYYRENITMRSLIRPSIESSTISYMVANRIRLPLLGLVLVSLIANFVVSSDINEKYNQSRAKLNRIEKNRGQADDLSRQKQQILSEFNHALPYNYSWFCDRAALVLPSNIILTSLSIQPLLKSIEEGRKLQLSERLMVISGEAPKSEDISDYVTALQRLSFASHVKLSSVEQNKDTKAFLFRINIEL